MNDLLSRIAGILDEDAAAKVLHAAVLEATAAYSLGSGHDIDHTPDFLALECSSAEDAWALSDRLRWCIQCEDDWWGYIDQESALASVFGEGGNDWLCWLFGSDRAVECLVDRFDEYVSEFYRNNMGPISAPETKRLRCFIGDWRTEVLRRLFRKVKLPSRAEVRW